MYTSSYDPQNQPLFYFRGFPVRLAVLLVLIHVTAMIVETFIGAESYHFLTLAAFPVPGTDSPLWPSWWQWGTWVLAHVPSSWFLLDMYLLWSFGSQLEQMMGRRFLTRLYLALIALPSVLVALALGLGLRNHAVLAGTSSVHFSLFMAVAFLHPDAMVCWLNIRIKYFAGALFAIYLLGSIYSRDGLAAALLVASVSLTYAIMRRYGLTPRFTRVTEAISAALPRPRKKEPRALPYTPKVLPRPTIGDDRPPVAKIDAILEKISRTGLDSLDEWERRELERASSELKRQDG